MFSTYRGLSQHNRHCTKRLNTVSISSSQPVTITERAELTKLFSQVTSFVWGEREGTLFIDDSNEITRKEFFMLPTGNEAKIYTKEVARLLNAWSQDTPLKSISLRAIHTMPVLLLQNPSKTSKH